MFCQIYILFILMTNNLLILKSRLTTLNHDHRLGEKLCEIMYNKSEG